MQSKKIVSTQKVLIIVTIPYIFFLPPPLSHFLLPYSNPFPSSLPVKLSFFPSFPSLALMCPASLPPDCFPGRESWEFAPTLAPERLCWQRQTQAWGGRWQLPGQNSPEGMAWCLTLGYFEDWHMRLWSHQALFGGTIRGLKSPRTGRG